MRSLLYSALRSVGVVVGNLFSFMVVLGGVGSGLSWALKISILSTTAVHWALGLALSLLLLGIMLVFIRSLGRNLPKQGAPMELSTTPGGVLGAFFVIALFIAGAFGATSFAIAHWVGADRMYQTPPVGREFSSVLMDYYLWHFLDMIPLVKINESLGWKEQLISRGGGTGLLLILFRLCILLLLFPLFAAWRGTWSTGAERRNKKGAIDQSREA